MGGIGLLFCGAQDGTKKRRGKRKNGNLVADTMVKRVWKGEGWIVVFREGGESGDHGAHGADAGDDVYSGEARSCIKI